MTITANQLQGNWAEQFIASELAAQGCLIRRVTQGHDSGIDLYCESLYNGIPFVHFWCQIKSSKQWTGKRQNISFSPEPRHVEYWQKQPVPVLIFLVPASESKQFTPYYICTPLHLKNKRVMSFMKVKRGKDLFMFLTHKLLLIAHEWDLKEGKVSPVKFPLRRSVVEFLPGTTLSYEKEIFNGLRWTLWRLISDIMFTGSDSTKSQMLNKRVPLTGDEKARLSHVKAYIEALKTLIEAKNDRHYEGYFIIGNYCELSGNFDISLGYYRKSLEIVSVHLERDSQNPHLLDLQRTIQRNITRVEAKKAEDFAR